MKNITKNLTCVTLILALSLCLCACGGGDGTTAGEGKKEKLTIAYQWGLAYAPLAIMKERKLIEKHYGGDLEIEWKTMNGPAEIFEGMAAGSIDVGASGVGPFLINAMNTGQVKMLSAMSAQPMGLNTTRADVQSIRDIKPEDKIALVSYGAIQHIMLAMACEKELKDARALDKSIVTMSHPDGMQALLSGSVDFQLTTSPYFLQELEKKNIHEIKDVAAAFPKDASIIVGSASVKFHDEKPELYRALTAATEEAMGILNDQTDEAAGLLCDKEGISQEKMKEYLTADGVRYDMTPKGTLEIAKFMERAEFLEKAPSDLSEICFENLAK